MTIDINNNVAMQEMNSTTPNALPDDTPTITRRVPARTQSADGAAMGVGNRRPRRLRKTVSSDGTTGLFGEPVSEPRRGRRPSKMDAEDTIKAADTAAEETQEAPESKLEDKVPPGAVTTATETNPAIEEVTTQTPVKFQTANTEPEKAASKFNTESVTFTADTSSDPTEESASPVENKTTEPVATTCCLPWMSIFRK